MWAMPIISVPKTIAHISGILAIGVPAPYGDRPNVNGVVWNTWGIKTVTLSVTANGCTSTDIHQIAVSNSPTICERHCH